MTSVVVDERASAPHANLSPRFFELLQSSLAETVFTLIDDTLVRRAGPELLAEPEDIHNFVQAHRFKLGNQPVVSSVQHSRAGRVLSCRLSGLVENGFLVVVHDITEAYTTRHELESTLQYAEILSAEHHALEASMPDAYLLTTEEGTVVSFNLAAERLFGCVANEVIGQQASVLVHDTSSWQQLIDNALAPHSETLNSQMQGKRKDGTTFLMAIAVTKVNTPTGLYLSTIIRDLTTTLLRQREIEEARERAESATRAKSEFLANMSHEIRTPMNGVVGMLQLLLDSPLSVDQREHAQTAAESAQLLLTILNDILDFSKIEAGMLNVDPIEFSLQRLLSQTLDLVRVDATRKALSLSLDVDDNLAASFWGDEGRIRQVLLNLLSNAIKFTPKGCITLRVGAKAAPHSPSQQIVHVEVEDRGIGIAQDRVEHIFGKFTQAESSTTRRFGGTGLGLAISKQLIELMGGKIGVTSQLSRGSTFWFELSLPTIGRKSNQPAEHGSSVLRSGLRILLVEDNLVNQRVAERFLSRLGCSVHVASNGIEAIEAARRNPYDLVFMDCQMPEMDGYEATRHLRAAPETRTLPVVAMTANAMAGDREKCLDAGMNDFITKPVSRLEMTSILTRWTANGNH